MTIFQPDRFLLQRQIAEISSYIKGSTLDIGAGEYDRYSKRFGSKRYLRLDVYMHNNLDVIADAHALPFKKEAFDSIVCTQVLTALREPYTAIREFCRVLKKGGVILMTASQTDALQGEPFDYWRFTVFGFEQLCRSCDLNIIAMKQRGGFFTTMAQQFIRYCIHRFNLYHHQTMGRLFNWPLKLMARLLMLLDRLDTSPANRKHTIGWCVVARK